MPKSFRTVEIMNDIEHGFTLDVCKAVVDGWAYVKDYAYILHDSDIKADGTFKRPHIHCMIRFNSPCPTSAILARVKSVTGRDDVICENHLQKCFKWTSAVAYLTHENAPTKHRYERAQVVSNYDFGEDIDAGLACSKDLRLNEIISKIDSCEMRQFNYVDYCTALEYTKYKRQIDNAFEYVIQRESRKVDRSMHVLYFYGKPGVGKTTYAKHFCNEKHYSFCVSSSSNDPLQDYKGQDVLILDDFRPKGWTIPDLLKLLDNHTSSSVKSRYNNKCMVFCKMIIITSVVPLDAIWKGLDDDSMREPIEQLKRRISALYTIYKDKIFITTPLGVYAKDNPVRHLNYDVDTAWLRELGIDDAEEVKGDKYISVDDFDWGDTPDLLNPFDDDADCSDLDYDPDSEVYTQEDFDDIVNNWK